MKSILKLSVAFGALVHAGAAFAADPLVDVDWVTANLETDGVVFVDLRPQGAYVAGHVPGAVHSQYGGREGEWRVKVGEVRGLVGDPELIADHLGTIGISNEDHVVLIPGGKSSADMGAATRVYWTLNYLGHDEVSILNGGMAAYLKEKDDERKPVNPLEKGMIEVESAIFVADPQPEMIATAADVEAMDARDVPLVDHRTNDYYLGISKSGSAKAAGTIPGSVNLPHTWTTVNGGGSFRDPDQLTALYDAAGVPVSGPQVSFCNTGHLASIGWFVSHELLGNEEAVVYDGSMADWTHSGRSVERKIEF